MTIGEAIFQTDTLKPNQYSPADKIKWLSEIDGIVKNEIIDTHEGRELITFTPYADDTSLETVLLVPEPYSNVYVLYLFTKIDFNNAEFTRFNNSVIMYNVAYENYAKYYNRKYMPLQKNSISISI